MRYVTHTCVFHFFLCHPVLTLTTLSNKGVGTAGITGALFPAMLKSRGRKYLFAPAIMPSLSAGYTQFCIAGLQERSAEEPNMHQNFWRSWLRPGLVHHWGSLQRPPYTYLVGRGASWNSPRLIPARASRSLAPTILISFRRHCYRIIMLRSTLMTTWSVCLSVVTIDA